MSVKLHVGGLSWNTTAEMLAEAFGAFGPVVETSVVSDSISGRSRGYGFVSFQDPRDARDAIREMNKASLDGATIEVRNASDTAATPGGGRRW